MGIRDVFNAAEGRVGRAFNRGEKSDLSGKKPAIEMKVIKPAEAEAEDQNEYSINIGGETKKSDEHKINQDNFYMGERTMAVFDGMGGHAGGEIASGMAAEGIPEFDEAVEKRIAVAEKNGKRLTSEEEIELIREELEQFLKRVNSEICRRGEENPDLKGLGSTVSVMRFTRDGKKVVLGQMGDSRIYRLRGGRLERISPEDSLVEVAIKHGLIVSDQDVQIEVDIDRVEEKMREVSGRKDMEKYEKQKALDELYSLMICLGRIRNGYRARSGIDRKKIPLENFRHIMYGSILGRENSQPHIVTCNVEAGDRYLVSSDGIHDNLTDEQITQIMSRGDGSEEIAKKLVVESKRISQDPKNPRAKDDDMTAIVVEVVDRAEAREFEMQTRLKKTRENLEADLEKFKTTLNILGIEEIRNILETLTRERNALETQLKNNPNDKGLILQLEFARRKEALTARRLEEEYNAQRSRQKNQRDQ